MAEDKITNAVCGDVIDDVLAQDTQDTELSDVLRRAYDALDPTPDQEDRMLARMLAAQREKDALPETDGQLAAAAGQASASEGQTPAAVQTPATEGQVPAANRVRAFSWRRAVVPLAACLIVGAVAVGSFGALTQRETPAVTGPDPSPSAAATVEEDVLAGEPALGAAAKGEAVEDMAYVNGAASAYEVDGGLVMGDVDFNTEEYGALKETGFVSTKANPLSTVSADVDTASYCNLRRMIEDGYGLGDIPSGSVRIEEMLNYFDYDYAAPEGDDLFSMQAQSAVCPWNEDTQLLVLGFATGPEDRAAIKGSNLVFLIDVSGSMDSPDKLDLLQDSFATLLDSLGPDDRVSIVTYASGEEIVLEGAHGDDSKAILKAIYKLHADGSTNGEAGLAQAYEVAQRNFIEGGVNRIIMASDGDLNVGITSESDLYDFVEGKRDTGIYLSVLGFGSGNYKDNKMEVLADHGNGSYHYIDSIDEAERVLKEKLTANLVPFADNVKVQVEFNPSQVKAYRLIGYENRELADEDFRDDAVDAGDVGPESQFTVAYEVVLADSKMDIPEPDLKYQQGSAEATGAANSSESSEWLTCSMRYHAFNGDEMREQQLVVDDGAIAAQPSDDWKFAAAVIEFGMIARDSEFAGTSSVDSVLDLLGTGLPDDRDGFKRLVVKAG